MPYMRNATAGNDGVPEGQAGSRSEPSLPAPNRALLAYSGAEFVAFSEGYASGYVAGMDRGRQLADDEAAALWRNAARIVHALANVPTHDELEAIRRDYSGAEQ
ncbi:hypothetical protein [Terrabacter sp. BE26]|uniref:hypothetical protein n=1 Tax=Terrabacter sp. BE26 TaxID=2898152 RepID=UPI0035BE2EE0